MDLLERYPRRVRAACFIATRSSADDEAGRDRRSAMAAEAERLASDRPAVHAPFAGATVLVAAAIVLAGGFLQTFLADGFARRALVEGLGLIR